MSVKTRVHQTYVSFHPGFGYVSFDIDTLSPIGLAMKDCVYSPYSPVDFYRCICLPRLGQFAVTDFTYMYLCCLFHLPLGTL